MSQKEIYRLGIKITVNGDGEAKKKLSAVEKMTQQMEKKAKALEKLKINASAKIKDDASKTIDKITSRASKLNTTTITAKVKAKDEASKVIDKASYKTGKFNNTTATAKIKAKDEASKTISKIETKLSNLKKSIGSGLITGLTIGAVAIGGMGLSNAVKTYADYEQVMSNVKAVTGTTAAEMKQLDELAIKLGASTSFSAKESAEGILELAKSGLTTQQVLQGGLAGALDLAAAGDLELKDAAEIASTVLNAFKKDALSVADAANILAGAANASATDVGELKYGLSMVSAVASGVGLSFKDTSTALATFAQNGLRGSDAGTSLKTMLLNLQPKTDKAYDEFERLGLMTYNTSKAMEFLSSKGIKYTGNSFEQIDPYIRSYVGTISGAKIGTAKFDKAYREFTQQIGASQSVFYDNNGNLKSLSDISGILKDKLGGLNSAQRQMALNTLFGTDAIRAANILYEEGAEGVNNMAAAMDKVTAKETAAEKLNNLKGAVEELSGAVETTKIESIKKIAPQLQEFVEWVTSKVPAIGDVIVNTFDYISKHTEELKMLAKGIAGVTVALLGLSAVGKIGNAVSGVKDLTSLFKGAKLAKETTTVASGLKNLGVIGKALPLIFSPAGLAIAGAVTVAGTAIAANNSLMKKSLSTTTEELTTVEKIINKLSGSTYKSKKEMQGLGLIYEDFGKNVSDDFKSMVEESTRNIREFQFFLNEINLDGEIDKTESSKFDSKIQEMMTSAVKTIEENKSKAQEGLKTMFMDNGTFSEAEKATLEYLSKNYDTQIEAEKNLKEEIYNIKKRAIDEKRELNNEDLKNIKAYQTRMAQIMLESAGGNADEILFAKNKFKARAEGVDLKEGSALAQEAAKDRDSKIVDIKSKYDTYIAKLENELANANNETDKNNIRATIKENKKAKQEKISNVNSLYDDNLNTLFNSNSNLKGKINIYDGTELTDGDKKAQSSLEKMKKRYSDMQKITESGYYGIRNSSTGAINDMYVSVDKRTGDIIGAWSATTCEIGAYTSEIKNQVREMGDTHNSALSGAIQKLGGMGVSYDAVSGNIIRLKDGITEMIGPLENVKKAADGTATGIITLNETPVQVTTNADGAIIGFSNVKEAMDGIPSNVDITINENTNEATAGANGYTNAVNNIPKGKTTIITTIFKKIIEGTNQAIGFETGVRAGASKVAQAVGKKATGTSFASKGLSTIDEQGWELSAHKSVPIIGSHGGNPLTYLSQGTKILNHMQSVQDMKNEVSHQVDTKIAEQPRQMQYQLIQAPQQPQVQVSGVGGINFGDISVSVNGVNDVDSIIVQATQEFARKLKESFGNIKK